MEVRRDVHFEYNHGFHLRVYPHQQDNLASNRFESAAGLIFNFVELLAESVGADILHDLIIWVPS